MSNTRHAAEDSPLNQERYMSAPAFAELRGISATATAARAALLPDPRLRGLLWFIQARSLKPGGLRQIAQDILAQYPGRITTPTLRDLKLKPGDTITGKSLYAIEREIDGESRSARRDRSGWQSRHANQLRALADGVEPPDDEPEQASATASSLSEKCRRAVNQNLEAALTDFCINPERGISLGGFVDLAGALLEYQQKQEQLTRAEFVQTTVGSVIWDTLDHALKTRRLVLMEGLEGRGKTEAAKAWCQAHSGEARYVTLSGITQKTNVFRAIARALGIGSGNGYKSNELQSRVEDVLQRSRLMLVADESHFLFDPKPRMSCRPALVDWLVTSLINFGVPVGLVATPQFLESMFQAGKQTGWNWRQLYRRLRYTALPERNTESDFAAVARKLLPGAGKAAVKCAMGYALMSKRDLSAVGDVATEARIVAEADGRAEITYADVERAIKENLWPGDAAFARRLAQPESGRRRKAALPMQDPGDTAATEPPRAPDLAPLEPPGRNVTPAPVAIRGIPQFAGIEDG